MTKKIILLVTEDSSEVERITDALEKLKIKYLHQVVSTGADALAMLTSNPSENIRIYPDIILFDLTTQKTSGLEFLRIIKNYYSLNNIKIFVLTNSLEEYSQLSSQNLKVEGYIIKPFDADLKQADHTGILLHSLR